MIINHNMQSMNAHRQMGVNQTNAQKSMEKLSSGLRINRAGDDAAGLSISEKMRGQIRGLDQASRNAQDGISLIQTAEGALDESHAILQRMRELANQSANDTNVEADRNAISEEIGQLTKELDRITETTEFNTQNLLGGGFEGKLQVGANSGQTIDIKIEGMSSSSLGLTGGVKLNQEAITYTTTDGTKSYLEDGSYTVDKDKNLIDSTGNVVAKITSAAGSGEATITTADGNTFKLTNELVKGDTITIGEGKATVELAKGPNANSGALAAGDYKISGTNLMNGDKVVGTIDTATGKVTDKDSKEICDLKADYGMAATNFGNGDTFTIKGLDVSNSDKATGSLKTLDSAIEAVSKQRSSLGALQNRLEHTIKNLNNAAENTQAAESRIRDVDMAKEMMTMSKNNILSQASQAMLAQANQNPQQVLQLLR